MNEDIQQWIKIKKQEGKPLVCFCILSRDRIPDEYFREIYHEVKEYFSLCTITILEKDQFSMPGDIFRVNPDEVERLDGINIFIIIDSYVIKHSLYATYSCAMKFPERSFVVSFFHSFWGTDEKSNLINYKKLSHVTDALFLAPPAGVLDKKMLTEAHAYRFPPQKMLRKRDRFLFVSVGYPRIATIQRRLKNMHCELDSLLYAPASSRYLYNWGGRYEEMLHYGTGIVGQLLTDFPEYRIVFRPDVHSWEEPQTLALIAAHKGHPRFAVSRDLDHVPEFARAATVLTDYSNIAEVFSLSTLRPQLTMKLELNRQYSKVIPTGLLVHPASKISTAVKILIDPAAKKKWEEHIYSAYDRYIVAPEKTFNRITNALLCIANNKEPQHAVSIPRDWKSPHWDETDYIKQIFLHDTIDQELARLFNEDYPEDYVSGVIRIYASRKNTWNYSIEPIIRKQISTIVKNTEQFKRDRDIPCDICLCMLTMQKNREIKKNNIAYVSIIEALMEELPAMWEMTEIY